MFGLSFVVQSFLVFFQSSRLEETVGCFTLIDVFVSGGCVCSVALPRDAVGWPAVFDCGILFYFFIKVTLLFLNYASYLYF